jgi:hypothetical protein
MEILEQHTKSTTKADDLFLPLSQQIETEDKLKALNIGVAHFWTART